MGFCQRYIGTIDRSAAPREGIKWTFKQGLCRLLQWILRINHTQTSCQTVSCSHIRHEQVFTDFYIQKAERVYANCTLYVCPRVFAFRVKELFPSVYLVSEFQRLKEYGCYPNPPLSCKNSIRIHSMWFRPSIRCVCVCFCGYLYIHKGSTCVCVRKEKWNFFPFFSICLCLSSLIPSSRQLIFTSESIPDIHVIVHVYFNMSWWKWQLKVFFLKIYVLLMT